MALLRGMKKGGKGGKAGGPPRGVEALPPPEPALPMPLPPAMRHAPAHHGSGPVVHIHIGPNSPDAESPAGDLSESPAEEGAESLPPPMLLQKLHDKIQAARAAGRK